MLIRNYKNIADIKFPIYKIDEEYTITDGLVFIDGLVVDDRNMPSETLGGRRLLSPQKLYPLKKGINDIPTMLQRRWVFIDSAGKIFKYEKTRHHKLKYHKIKRIQKKEVASLIWFHGVSFPFEIPRPPHPNAEFGRILYFNGQPWLIYDFTRVEGKDTTRMV